MPTSNPGKSQNSGGGGQNGINVPALDKDLIRRADAAGIAVDYGKSGQEMYTRRVQEIQDMDLTQEEKQAAIDTLHKLTTAQLEAESKALSPYSMGVGPARFDANKMRSAADKSVQAKAATDAHMKELREQQKQKKREAEQAARVSAMRRALENGALEFTHNGETWARKSKRSRTFTRIK